MISDPANFDPKYDRLCKALYDWYRIRLDRKLSLQEFNLLPDYSEYAYPVKLFRFRPEYGNKTMDEFEGHLVKGEIQCTLIIDNPNYHRTSIWVNKEYRTHWQIKIR